MGYQRYGVPMSGPMDQQSAGLANLLAGNPPHSALLEMTYQGPTIHLDEPAVLAVTGAPLMVKCGDEVLEMNRAISLPGNVLVEFGPVRAGCRAYVAFRGGIQSPMVLGSQSQYAPITGSARLEAGERLKYFASVDQTVKSARLRRDNALFSDSNLAVWPGPDYALVANELLQLYLKYPLIIGENNRMGYQLLLDPSPAHRYEIITAPVQPGTMQLTPSGTLLALMRDAQVTGGYPRVFQMTSGAINVLAQKRSGEKVWLKLMGEM